MGTNFSFISELQTIRKNKAALSERESELVTPILTDTSIISTIYEHFKYILSQQEPDSFIESPSNRKKFVFIILCLYAPSALAGGRLPHGLRDRISGATKTDPTFISHNIENVVFQCQNIKGFRKELNCLYEKVESYLKSKNII